MDTDKTLEELQRRIEALEMAETIRKLKDELSRERQEKEALKRQMIEFLASFQMVFDWDFSYTLCLIELFKDYSMKDGATIKEGANFLGALFDIVNPNDPYHKMAGLGELYVRFHQLKKILSDPLTNVETPD